GFLAWVEVRAGSGVNRSSVSRPPCAVGCTQLLSIWRMVERSHRSRSLHRSAARHRTRSLLVYGRGVRAFVVGPVAQRCARRFGTNPEGILLRACAANRRTCVEFAGSVELAAYHPQPGLQDRGTGASAGRLEFAERISRLDYNGAPFGGHSPDRAA